MKRKFQAISPEVFLRAILTAVVLGVIFSACGGGRASIGGGFLDRDTVGANLPGKALGLQDVSASGSYAEGAVSDAREVELSDVLRQLDEMGAPPGVDKDIFAQLKDELAKRLLALAGGDGEVGGSRENAHQWARQNPALRKKLVSRPPTGDANRVKDLAVTDNGDGTYILSWSYRNVGDYNQDGVVDVADVAELGDIVFVPFEHALSGISSVSQDEPPFPEWKDGNSDGQIDIGDIPPIAENFFARVKGYAVEVGESSEGKFAEVNFVRFVQSTEWERKRFEVKLELPAGSWVRVVPKDELGERGVESDAVQLPLPTPPPNSIWIIPDKYVVSVGETILFTVWVNELAYPLRMVDSVRIDFSNGNLILAVDEYGSIVDDAGAPGGEPGVNDGVWAQVESTVGMDHWSLSVGDEGSYSQAWSILISASIRQSQEEIPAGSSGELFNFEMQAVEPGIANISFVRHNGWYYETYYTDTQEEQHFFDDSQKLRILILPAEERSAEGREVRKAPLVDSSRAEVKTASHAPLLDKDIIRDLSASDNGDGTFTLSWSYRNTGDFNQDGFITIADFARMVFHFFDSAPWAHPIDELIDANEDGVIDVADTAEIAENFESEVVGFAIEIRSTINSPWARVKRIPFDGSWFMGGRKRVTATIGDYRGWWVRVTPYDRDGVLGTPSDEVKIASE